MDVANALLNYGYGLLYGKVESGLIKAGIDPYICVLHRDEYNRPVLVYNIIESLELRLHKILDIVESPNRKAGNMIFFVMYDIASNKVRRAVVKYLERSGCHRVQRSIFLADTKPEMCQQIQKDLTVVQAMYDNKDSIFIVPLSIDYIRSMKVIGENIDFDLILKTRSTLFF